MITSTDGVKVTPGQAKEKKKARPARAFTAKTIADAFHKAPGFSALQAKLSRPKKTGNRRKSALVDRNKSKQESLSPDGRYGKD